MVLTKAQAAAAKKADEEEAAKKEEDDHLADEEEKRAAKEKEEESLKRKRSDEAASGGEEVDSEAPTTSRTTGTEETPDKKKREESAGKHSFWGGVISFFLNCPSNSPIWGLKTLKNSRHRDSKCESNSVRWASFHGSNSTGVPPLPLGLNINWCNTGTGGSNV